MFSLHPTVVGDVDVKDLMGRSHDLIVVFHFIDHKRGNVDSRAKIISNPGVRSNTTTGPLHHEGVAPPPGFALN